MTTTNENQTHPSDIDAHCVRQRITKEAEEGLTELQAAFALLCGIKAMAEHLVQEVNGLEASSLAWSLCELAHMATPRIDNAVGGFSDAISELNRVAPMLAAQARMEGEAHV